MLLELLAIKEINKPAKLPQPKPEQTVRVEKQKKKTIKPKLYKIKTGDTLNKLSKQFRVPVKRVLCANPKIYDPDVISAGDRLKIPNKKDKLKCPKNKSKGIIHIDLTDNSTIASSDNLYEYHSCTWYAKSRRPDLPNNLGNADTWYINAQAQGFAVGSMPRVGAVGQQGMHVVYIEKVKGNQVYLSERNYDFNGSYRERWANASDFLYIY